MLNIKSFRMKTIEQQKSELLDVIITVFKERAEESTSILEPAWISQYDAITSSTPKESTNPYIDEVFDMRICNVISDILNREVKKIQLSDCPHISELKDMRNIGIGSLQLYESTMQKYGLNDKLI
jgi:hypothetical protein